MPILNVTTAIRIAVLSGLMLKSIIIQPSTIHLLLKRSIGIKQPLSIFAETPSIILSYQNQYDKLDTIATNPVPFLVGKK